MIPGYPFISAPAVEPSPPQAKTLPPKLPGYVVTHLSCVPCGVRIDLDIDDKAKFLVQHIEHIRAFLENGTMHRRGD